MKIRLFNQLEQILHQLCHRLGLASAFFYKRCHRLGLASTFFCKICHRLGLASTFLCKRCHLLGLASTFFCKICHRLGLVSTFKHKLYDCSEILFSIFLSILKIKDGGSIKSLYSPAFKSNWL